MINTLIHTTVSAGWLDKYILRRWPECTGVDIKHDGPVYNACKGVVVFVGQDIDRRWCVNVQIDSKQIIRYSHLKAEYVSPNDAILDGVKIGDADEWVRIEYCTSDTTLLDADKVVRINGCTYFKMDPYSIVTGVTPITIVGTSAYDLAQNGLTTDYTQIINKDIITPYIATVGDSITTEKIFKELKNHDVVGVMLYGGGLFDSIHLMKGKYRSDNFKKQIQLCNKVEIPFGMYVDVKARNLNEAKEECKHLFYLISKYPPQLGLWLNISLTGSKASNDKILQYYMEQTFEWGLIGQVGLYCTKNQLDKISWKDKWCEYYLLWLISHDSRYIETTDSLLTPSDFKID